MKLATSVIVLIVSGLNAQPIGLQFRALGSNRALSERRVTFNPGHCSDNAGWYLYASDNDTVTVACAEDDSPQLPDSSDDSPNN